MQTFPKPKAKPSNKPVKRRLDYRGIPICIEYEIGDVKSGDWGSFKMCAPYGYISSGVVDKSDGEKLDVYLGDKELAKEVYVIDLRGENGALTEQKCFVGFGSQQSAEDCFDQHYTRVGSRGATDAWDFHKFSGFILDYRSHTGARLELEKAKQSLAANRASVRAYRAQASTKQKRKAQSRIQTLTESGKLKKPSSCPKCGRSGVKIEGHHPNHGDTDKIVWRCRKCHAARDTSLHGSKMAASQKKRKSRA